MSEENLTPETHAERAKKTEPDWHWEDAGDGWIKKVHDGALVEVDEPVMPPSYIAAKLVEIAKTQAALSTPEGSDNG